MTVIKRRNDTRCQHHVRIEESPAVIQKVAGNGSILHRLVNSRPVYGKLAAVVLDPQKVRQRTGRYFDQFQGLRHIALFKTDHFG